LTKKTLIHIKATLKSPPRQYGGRPYRGVRPTPLHYMYPCWDQHCGGL